MKLIRFWIKFKNAEKLPGGFGQGCGITAYDRADAEKILVGKLSKDFPKILEYASSWEENVDVSKLDQGHVIPNMGISANRGIWFPLGFD